MSRSWEFPDKLFFFSPKSHHGSWDGSWDTNAGGDLIISSLGIDAAE